MNGFPPSLKENTTYFYHFQTNILLTLNLLNNSFFNQLLQVWSKGGFLRSDTLVGTAQVKLAPLGKSVHTSSRVSLEMSKEGGQSFFSV